jgi:hypothetical protein
MYFHEWTFNSKLLFPVAIALTEAAYQKICQHSFFCWNEPMGNHVKQNSCKLGDMCPAINPYLGWLPSKYMPSDCPHTLNISAIACKYYR